MLTDEQFKFIVEGCEGMELDAIWDYFEKPLGTKKLRHNFVTFDQRREAFLWVLRRLIEENRISLVNMKTHLAVSGSVDQQVDLFRIYFPKNDTEMNGGVWFFSEFCPGGSAWIVY
jgi:hypothetical protein